MAFQSLNGGFYWPDLFQNSLNANMSEQSTLLDASGEKIAFIFVAPKTGNIDKVHIRVPGHTTNSTLTLTLETIDATNGRPSGTLVGTGATGTVNTTGTGTYSVTFGATLPAVTKGTQYALVVTQGTPGSLTVSHIRVSSGGGWKFNRLAYTLTFLSSTWLALSATIPTSDRPNIAVRYDDGNYYYTPGLHCFSAATNTAFNSASDPVERGMFFQVPFPARVSGFYWMGASHSGDWKVILASTDGTELASFTGDKDQVSFYAAGTGYPGCAAGYFSTEIDLTADTKYYLTVRPTTATNIAVTEHTQMDTSVSAMGGMFNGGTLVGQVRRASGGTYTETATARPLGMGLIFSAFDGGGGGTPGIIGDGSTW